jgi:hypothetical protein
LDSTNHESQEFLCHQLHPFEIGHLTAVNRTILSQIEPGRVKAYYLIKSPFFSDEGEGKKGVLVGQDQFGPDVGGVVL